MIPIIDAHLDLAWNALSFNRDLTLPLDDLKRCEEHMTDARSRGQCTVCLPELQRADVTVCVATLLARSGPEQTMRTQFLRQDLDYASQAIAAAVAAGQLAYYRLLEQHQHVRMIATKAQLEHHWQSWQVGNAPLGIILGMEGCDPIESPERAAYWWEQGLRVAGLVHYGRSHYGYGTTVSGPLSDKGIALLHAFQQLGMILDVTHLCDESMYQALEIFSGRLLASHHNCRALVPGDRQLNDRQIKLLLERDAVIGIAMDGWMLYPGWVRGETSRAVLSLTAVADHIDHVCQLAGNTRHAAIGSDLDGGFGADQTPRELNTIADLQLLHGILAERGYKNEEVATIFYGNWLRFFLEALP